MRKLSETRTWAAILFILFSAVCLPAYADPIADFYSKHMLTIVVGADPGGTYDLYARTIARRLGSHIPGAPKVIVENMPGAGGYIAAMRVLQDGPQDGSMIGALGSSALPFQPLLDPNSPKLDVQAINWLGSVSSYNVIMLVRSDVPVYSLADLRKHQTVMATIAPGQLNSVIVAATNAALGAKIKGVNGHLGMAASMLALERGEIDGYPTAPVDALKRGYSKQIADGKLRLLLQFGPSPSPVFPKVPYALDSAKTPEQRSLLEVAQGPLGIGYAYMMGPGVPKDRARVLRDAFDATLQDPAFLADAKRQILSILPVSGEEIRTRLAEAYKTPAQVIAPIRAVYGK